MRFRLRLRLGFRLRLWLGFGLGLWLWFRLRFCCLYRRFGLNRFLFRRDHHRLCTEQYCGNEQDNCFFPFS